MHLIINAEVPLVVDPGSGGGDGGGGPSGCGGSGGSSNDSGGSDDGRGGAAGSRAPSAFGRHLNTSSPSGNDSASQRLKEALEALLFPGAVPMPPLNPADSTNVPPPPAILSISPAAVHIPPHAPGKCSSSSDCSGGPSMVSVTLTLHLSRPLQPEEGVTLLARHRQNFLDVRMEPASSDCKEQCCDSEVDGLTLKVRRTTRHNPCHRPHQIPPCGAQYPMLLYYAMFLCEVHNIDDNSALSPLQVSLQLPNIHTSSHPLPLLGLVHLEFMDDQTHVMGRQAMPLLLLPNAAAAEEASLLLASSSSFSSLPARGGGSIPTIAREPMSAPTSFPTPRAASSQGVEGSSSAASPFLLDLACWLDAATSSSSGAAAEGRQLLLSSQLLSHCLDADLPGCAEGLMDVLMAARGVNPCNLIHTFIAEKFLPPAPPVTTAVSELAVQSVEQTMETSACLLTPLHLAVRRGSLRLINSLLAWAERHSVRPDWTVAGPSGICPLHLAALLPNAEVVVRGMLELPLPYGPDIAAAWLLCRSSDGRTPAELGSMVGLPASLDGLAHDALLEAAKAAPARTDPGGASGLRSGRSNATSPMPESNDGVVLHSNGSPLISQSHATGRIEAGLLRLCRLLLLGFPDRSVEQRYAQYKVWPNAEGV